MTPSEAAARLDGNEYRLEGSQGLFEAMKLFGLVAVFGASDDLMEFRGAINDEIACYNGGTAYVTRQGLLTNDCDSENCPHYERSKDSAVPLVAKWDVNGFSWVYDTQIPHETFIIKEGDENYCKGIVFALADVPHRDIQP